MIREIDAYTMYAIGSGCFMNGDRQQKIRDRVTGELRKERVFTLDREVDYEDIGTIEIGERAAQEIAHLLGWVSPEAHAAVLKRAVDAEHERDKALAEAQSATEAYRTGAAQSAQAFEEAETAKKELADLKKEMTALKRDRTTALRKIGALEKEITKLTNYGD